MQNPNLSTRFDKGLELATLALTPFPGEVFGVCVCVCGGGGGATQQSQPLRLFTVDGIGTFNIPSIGK